MISFIFSCCRKKALLSFLIGWMRASSMIFNHETDNQLALLVKLSKYKIGLTVYRNNGKSSSTRRKMTPKLYTGLRKAKDKKNNQGGATKQNSGCLTGILGRFGPGYGRFGIEGLRALVRVFGLP